MTNLFKCVCVFASDLTIDVNSISMASMLLGMPESEDGSIEACR